MISKSYTRLGTNQISNESKGKGSTSVVPSPMSHLQKNIAHLSGSKCNSLWFQQSYSHKKIAHNNIAEITFGNRYNTLKIKETLLLCNTLQVKGNKNVFPFPLFFIFKIYRNYSIYWSLPHIWNNSIFINNLSLFLKNLKIITKSKDTMNTTLFIK